MICTSIRIGAGIGIAVIAVALASCGDTEERSAPSSPATSAIEQVAAHNDADVTFAQMMIPHHEQALELTALVPDRSTDVALTKLASTITAEQRPEMVALRALLLQWGADPRQLPPHGDMGMEGMVDDATMARLASLNGAAFDTLWLQSMISHHQGAIEMANVEIANGRSADMMTMARNIVTAQESEIEQMKQMLGE